MPAQRSATQPSDTSAPAPQDDAAILRPPDRSDGAAMWELAQGAVDSNSPYAYVMLCEYFAASCVVAERDGAAVGFVTGFRPPEDPSTLFVWQIVVGPAARGTGLGSRMLDHLADRPSAPPVTTLEATVTPDNTASRKLFRSFARRRGVECTETPLFAAADFPTDAGPHEPEDRFRIGPWSPQPDA